MDTSFKKTLLSLILGCLIFGLGLYARIALANMESAFCISGQPCGSPGEQLDQVSYLFVSPPAGTPAAVSTPLGVFLGTYAVTFRTCTAYQYNNNPADPSWSCNTPTQSSAGYGLLFMEYPTNEHSETCPEQGCRLVPSVKILIPYTPRGVKWDWAVARLKAAPSDTGHEWEMTTEVYLQVDVNVRTVMADFDFPYGIEP